MNYERGCCWFFQDCWFRCSTQLLGCTPNPWVVDSGTRLGAYGAVPQPKVVDCGTPLGASEAMPQLKAVANGSDPSPFVSQTTPTPRGLCLKRFTPSPFVLVPCGCRAYGNRGGREWVPIQLKSLSKVKEAGDFLSRVDTVFAGLKSIEIRRFYLREPLNVVYLPAPTQSVVV